MREIRWSPMSAILGAANLVPPSFFHDVDRRYDVFNMACQWTTLGKND